ncbi:hypothetical protein HMPREF2861_01685 [Lactobacillus sp. HMSC068F07]|nr:hypothetical protein HMPREF2861_01685 [Lactobacillus sp. HMSC068F07]
MTSRSYDNHSTLGSSKTKSVPKTERVDGTDFFERESARLEVGVKRLGRDGPGLGHCTQGPYTQASALASINQPPNNYKHKLTPQTKPVIPDYYAKSVFKLPLAWYHINNCVIDNYQSFLLIHQRNPGKIASEARIA